MLTLGTPRVAFLRLRAGPLAAVAALIALLAAGGPARAEAPATFMQRVANELVAAVRSGSQVAIASVIRRHADVASIGTYSLGSYARVLPAAERPSYYAGMVSFIARYGAKEAPKYPVASAVVLSQTEEDKNGVYVDSRVTLTSGDTYDVRWWLVRRGASFKVRDAQVLGFWMSPFLKDLFEKYIGENGGNPRALVVALNR
jgi:phospholipid transport system substrate-binding protein